MVELLRNSRVTLVLFLLTTVVPADVWAHATLVRSAPANGAILAEAPQEVRLWFDENISSRFSSAQLLNLNNQSVALAGIHTDASDPKQLILRLRELPHGVYSVLAKTLSEADGHVSRSVLVFGVGERADLDTAVVAATEGVPPWPEVVLRWGNFILLAAVVGAVAVVPLVLVPAGATLSAAPAIATVLGMAGYRVLAWAQCCAGLAVLAGLGLLLWQATTLGATLLEGVWWPSVVWQVLRQTRWGALWLVRQGLLLVLIGIIYGVCRSLHNPAESQRPTGAATSPATFWVQPGRWSVTPQARLWLVAALLSVALLTVQALTGHAAAVTPQTSLAVVTDTLHLLAASLWIGGLLALGVGLWPLMRHDWAVGTALAYAGWRRFGWLAAPSVGLLVVTGLYNMSRQVASLDAVLSTLYGQVLLLKLGLVLAVGACGLLNAMLLHPRVAAPLAWLLRRPSGWTPCSPARLPGLLWGEAGLALLVLLATSVVTAAPAPRGPEFTIAPADIPTVLSQSVGDVVATLSVQPNRPGQNVLTVFAASTRRPPPADIMRVLLRFTYQSADLGRVSATAQAIGRDRFLISGTYLSLAGPWRIDVVVRRQGVEDTIAQFDWIVAPPGALRPVVISKAPLASVLTGAAAGTMVTVLLLAILAWPGWRQGHRAAGERQWSQPCEAIAQAVPETREKEES